MTDEGSNTRIIKNTIYLYLRSFLMMAISLFTSRVILQAIGIDDFGLYGVIGSIIAMFTILNGVLAVGTSRFLTFEMGKENKEKLRETFSASFAMHGILAIVLFVIFEVVGVWFLNHKIEIPEGREFAANVVYQLSVFTCLLGLTQVPYGASIIAHEKMSIYAYVGIAEATFKLLLTFALLYIPFVDTLISYAIIMALWSVGLQIFYRIYCIKHFEECHLKICRKKEVYKNMLSYSLWDFVGQFCATGNSQGTNILINMFFGVAVNAARSVAYQVEGVLTTFSGNFMTSINPQIVKSYARDDMHRFFQLINEAGRFSFFLLLIVSMPVFIEADYILHLWLTEVPEDTVLFLRCVMAITLFRVLARPLINGIHATGNVKFLNMTSGVYSVMTTLPILYLLYKANMPVWYCFILQGFNSVVCTGLEILSLRREVKFNIFDYLRKVYFHSFGVASLACIAPAIIFFMIEPGIFRLVTIVLVSILSTSLFVYTLGLSQSMRAKVNQKISETLQVYGVYRIK